MGWIAKNTIILEVRRRLGMKWSVTEKVYIGVTVICVMATVAALISKPAFKPRRTDGYIFIDSDRMILDEVNLTQLDYRLLYLAKNEIYARRGYIFHEKALRDYFKTRAWYQPKFFGVGNLTSIETKNIQSFERYMHRQKQALKKEAGESGDGSSGGFALFDLDGNNEMDEVRYTILGKYRSDFRLQVNRTVLQGAGEALRGGFRIVDLNIDDPYKEIAIEQYGLEKPVTLFYGYDGKFIRLISKVNGLCGNYRHCDGTGRVFAVKRADLLFNWPLKEEYRLNEARQLERSTSYPSFFRTDGRVELTIKKSFYLLKKVNGNQKAFTVKRGEKVRLLGTDNFHWCLLANESGQTGWFAVDNFSVIRQLGLDAREVFAELR
jgi:hypothetical protein